MSKRFWPIVAAVIFLTIVRIATTYLIFSQTVDEPVHIAAGHEWLLSLGRRSSFDPEHPPLARVVFALPFIRVRAKTVVQPSQIQYAQERVEYGNDLLETEDRYIHNLAKARRGNLFFAVVAMLFVALIARKLFGDGAGIAALILFASLPPFLAHAGLATTDIAGTAGFAAALFALLQWCDARTWQRTLLLGLAIGFGVICKYSFLPFFAAAAIIILIVRRGHVQVPKVATALAIAFAIVWLAFGLTVDTMWHADPDAGSFSRVVLHSENAADIPLPAPAFFAGLLQVKHHDRVGHPNFLYGKESNRGWWYYFPVVLVLKTPIPFLLLAAAGMWRRDAVDIILISAAILAICMFSSINIGVRHLLPIYVPLAVIAGAAVVRYRVAGGVLIAWMVIGSLLAHPDYVPWMNAFAGRHPETVLEDSNFDWGQDILRMVKVLRKRHIDRIGYALFTNIRPSSVHYTNGYIIDPDKKSSGWIVVSEQKLQPAIAHDPNAYKWLASYPFERVGKTIRLYRVP